MLSFRMLVNDTFPLSDGTTIFAGQVETDADLIPPCECEVVQDNRVLTSFRIQGEVIASKKPNYITDRVISTSAPVDLSALGLGRGGFVIRPKGGL